MKITEFVESFPKLSETFILKRIVELCKRGHNVRIVAGYHMHEKKIHGDVFEYNLLDKTTWISDFIADFPDGKSKMAAFLKVLAKEFLKRPICACEMLADSFSFFPDIFKCIDSFLAASFPVFGKDLAIIQFPGKWILRKIKREKPECPYILIFAAHDIYMKKEAEKFIKYKKTIENASAIITISEHNREFLKEKLKIDSKISVIYEGVSEKYLNFEQTTKAKGNRIISVCRFVEQKGIPYLIGACNLLKTKGVKFEVVLVGEGEEEGKYKELIKNRGLENEFIFTGSLNQEEVKKEISKSSIMVLPCVIARDGSRDILPTILKEAMALRKPVITSDISGIQELVENGKSGILVPEKNPAAIADAIEKLLKNPKLREKMGIEGRKKIEKDFNTKTEIDKLERILWGIKNE